MVAVAASWSIVVELTPASAAPVHRQHVHRTPSCQLDFGYNGFGRVGGEQGGPGSTKKYPADGQPPLVRPGVDVPRSALEVRYLAAHPLVRHLEPPPVPRVHHHARVARGRHRGKEIPFASTHLTPARIFGRGLGDQAGWDVVLALLGLIALVIAVRRREDRRAPGLFVLGGWFLVELLTLDFSSGIVHPYYASALGPGLAVMVGAGAVALASLVRSANDRTALIGYVLAVLAIGGTVGVQLFLIGRYGDPTWWRIPLVAIAIGAVVAIPLDAGARGDRARDRGRGAARRADGLQLQRLARARRRHLPDRRPLQTTPGTGGYGARGSRLRVDPPLIHYLRHAWRDEALRAAHASPPTRLRPLILLGLARRRRGRLQHDRPGAERRSPRHARRRATRPRYFLIGGPYAVARRQRRLRRRRAWSARRSRSSSGPTAGQAAGRGSWTARTLGGLRDAHSGRASSWPAIRYALRALTGSSRTR